ncbi:hypothetical protein TNCV_3466271 [Trichonephila clavipes]|nr:hypothetical protein TNCV_3466271 [Trichonephila clavipes]
MADCGTGLEPVTKQATVRYLYHSAIAATQSPDNAHSVAFFQRSISPRLIEDETFNDSDIINNLIDYEDGQEEELDSLRVDKNMQGSRFPTTRRRFVEWAQNEIAVVPDFHKRILFSDEAHFWLNGYVNKQNCRIWSEANPQVYVETPLHPEKLTVWCALWAGGILLQKR